MTEKRFTLTERKCYFTSLIFDNQENEKMGSDEAMECLNALHEENRELRRHLDVMRSGALTDDRRIKELYDENEQLRQEKQLLYENIDLLKRFIENQGFKVKLDDKLFRVI